MADLKTIEDIKSLTDDVENFFENPNFTPKKQNKFFFSEGTSYYKQLLEVSKVIKLLQKSISSLYENEKSIQQEIDELDIETLTTLKTKVDELETKATDLINRVGKLESDNVSNKNDIGYLKNETVSIISEIDSINARNNEQDTKLATHDTAIETNTLNITNNKNSIDNLNSELDSTQEDLNNVKENYLKDVVMKSNDITFTDVSKEGGVKTIQAVVTSSTPADLGTQLTAIKEQNTDVVSKVENKINEDTANEVINVTQDVTTLKNGIPTTETNDVLKLDTNDFAYDETTNTVSTSVDLNSLGDNVNTILGNYIKNGTQNDVHDFGFNGAITANGPISMYGQFLIHCNESENYIKFEQPTYTGYHNLIEWYNAKKANISYIFRNDYTDGLNRLYFITKDSAGSHVTSMTIKYPSNDCYLLTTDDINISLYAKTADIQPQITNNTSNIATLGDTVNELDTKVTNNTNIINENSSKISDNTININTNASNISHLQGYWASTSGQGTTAIAIAYTAFSDFTYDSSKYYSLDTYVMDTSNIYNISSLSYSDVAITVTFGTAIPSGTTVKFNLKEI